MLPSIVVALSVFFTISPDAAGYSMTEFGSTSQGSCMNTSDCPPHQNLICLHVYRGCQRGHCTCNPETSAMDDSRKCVSLLKGGERCNKVKGMCRKPMLCSKGLCRCPSGYDMFSDKKHCLKNGIRLVGESCSLWDVQHGHQKCFRQTSTGFTQNDVKCSTTSGLCVCNEGFKTHKHQCLPRRLHEWGCLTSMHCEGGAVCNGGKCVCPTGYVPDDDLYKCLKVGAVTNVELGGSCDEVNETSYCSPGLVCYRCSGEKHDKCIKFLLSAKYGMSSSSQIKSRITIVIISTIFVTIFSLTFSQMSSSSSSTVFIS